MSLKDRLGEFKLATQSIKARRGVQQQASSNRHSTAGLSELSSFTKIAKKIGYDINATFAKLEKLTLLAKSKSLFDDRPQEIQELTYIIKQDINTLNQQLIKLQNIHQQSRHSKQISEHSNGMVVSLQSKLNHMSGNFKNVLELRTQNMKNQKERRDQFTASSHPSSSPSSRMMSPSKALPPSNSSQTGTGQQLISSAQQQQQQQSMMMGNDQSYLNSREEAVESIQATIIELGEMMNKLGNLIVVQGEQVQRIDDNVAEMEVNVVGAHGELMKYFQNISSDRWLMIKIFFVLLIFFIVFVVFVA